MFDVQCSKLNVPLASGLRSLTQCSFVGTDPADRTPTSVLCPLSSDLSHLNSSAFPRNIPPEFPMSERIEINPEVCNGRPVIRGTRVTVDTVLAYLSAGDAVADILNAHPRIEREDVLACIEYARCLSAARSTVLLAS